MGVSRPGRSRTRVPRGGLPQVRPRAGRLRDVDRHRDGSRRAHPACRVLPGPRRRTTDGRDEIRSGPRGMRPGVPGDDDRGPGETGGRRDAPSGTGLPRSPASARAVRTPRDSRETMRRGGGLSLCGPGRGARERPIRKIHLAGRRCGSSPHAPVRRRRRRPPAASAPAYANGPAGGIPLPGRRSGAPRARGRRTPRVRVRCPSWRPARRSSCASCRCGCTSGRSCRRGCGRGSRRRARRRRRWSCRPPQ